MQFFVRPIGPVRFSSRTLAMRYLIGTLVLGGLLAVGPALTWGQDGVQYGLTLGVNRATMDSPEDLETRSAFVGGLILRKRVYGPVSLQSEVLLSQKGARVEAEPGGAIDYGAGYLVLPLLVRLAAPPLRSIVVHGEAGGFGAVKIFERQTPGQGTLNLPLNTGVSFFKRMDAGVAAGAGAVIPIRDQRFNLVVRRVWGMVDVARDVSPQPFPEAAFPSRGRTRTWSILLRLGL